ncbi:unnamed protein product [Polarella glacialis]|uniref:Uncharacterized protein n=1 Tax=Polarella glacialis TaxID=89957 RepID=A0A813GRU7_POLGL|nr:unnamed protein product [Polarella glacialis]
MVSGCALSVQLPIFQSLGVSGVNFQLAQVVLSTPWATKSWIGVLSDCCPIGRYHKRGYLLLSSILGVSGIVGLLLLPGWHPSPTTGCWLAAVFFLLINLQIATFDLLSEGKYAEIMRKTRGVGSEVLSLVWSCVSLGYLVGAVLVFVVVDRHGAAPLLAFSLMPMLLVAWLAARGDLPEQPARSREALKMKMLSQPRLLMLAVVMAAGSVIVSLSAALAPARLRLVITISVSLGMNVCCFLALPRTLAMSNCYLFLASAAYVDLSGPLAYYYTAQPNCVPDGPHFSYGYYIAVGQFVGAISGGLGSVLFQGMRSWTFQQAFCLTTLVQVTASIFDIVIVNRWNLRVGISDQAIYLFGDAACQSLGFMLMMLPETLLISRLCPKGVEATVFAILAGFTNFGAGVSRVIGAWLAEELGIHSSGAARGPHGAEASCDFSALPWALVLCHMLLPLLVLPLTWWMVPCVRMDDELAFEVGTPPPCFKSPPASPTSASPVSPHAWPDQLAAAEAEGYASYDELPGSPCTECTEEHNCTRHLSMVMVGSDD